MAAGQRKLAWELELQTRGAQQALNQFANQAKGALNPNSKAFQKELETLNQLQARMNSLSQSAIFFAKQGDAGAAGYSKVTAEMAGIARRLRDLNQDQAARNQLVAHEIELRKQASEAAASAKSGALPTASAPGTSGRSRAFAEGIGTAGGAAKEIAGLAGFALSLGAAAGFVNQLGDRMRATSEIISDSGGKFDQLRKSTQDLRQAQDRLANHPLITAFETFKNNLQTTLLDFAKGATEGNKLKDAGFSAGGSGENARRATRLIGDAANEFNQLGQQRADLEKDLAMQRLEFEQQIAVKRRDFLVEARQLEIETARTRQSLAIDASRKEQDYLIASTKFRENFEGQQAQRRFQISQEVAAREHAERVKDAAEDFNLRKQFDTQEFELRRQQSRESFANTQADKTQDFAKNRIRSLQDARDQLSDMALSGAGGLEYFRFAREKRKELTRSTEDFGIEQSRAYRDRSIQERQEGQTFALGQQRAGAEFAVGQRREGREFAEQQVDAIRQRALEIEGMLNERRWASIELEVNHQRALQDAAIALEKFTQDTDLARERLANRGKDLGFEESTGRAKLGFDQEKQLRGQQGSELAFANNLVQTLPAQQLQDLMKSNPQLADWIRLSQARRGLPVPAVPTGAGRSQAEKVGGVAGDIVSGNAPRDFFSALGMPALSFPFAALGAGIRFANGENPLSVTNLPPTVGFNPFQGGGNNQLPPINIGERTINVQPGIDAQKLEAQMRALVAQSDQDLYNKIVQMLRDLYRR